MFVVLRDPFLRFMAYNFSALRFISQQLIFSFDSWKRFFPIKKQLLSDRSRSLCSFSCAQFHFAFVCYSLLGIVHGTLHTVRHLVVWDWVCVCVRKEIKHRFVWWNYYLFLLLLSFGRSVFSAETVTTTCSGAIHSDRHAHTCTGIACFFRIDWH